MSSLFLFGAGASFGSGPCHPHAPPLGAGLFAALKKEGRTVATIEGELADLFSRDFEAGMDKFFAERNVETSAFLREMAAYFARFEPREGNAYSKLLAILGGTRKKATFVTTNYDLLIEMAISQAGLLITYGGPPVAERNVPVIKIHGSCNFLPNLQPNQIRGIGFDLGAAPRGAILESGVRAARSADEVLEFCRREDAIAPAIAMVTPDKRVLYCRGFIQEQQSAWKAALKAASRTFIIGLRVHPVDEHIWKPLASALCPLFYVGLEPQAFTEWARNERRKSAFSLGGTFEDALPIIRETLRVG